MEIIYLDPKDIIVGERFRKKDNPKYGSILSSIKKFGVIQPILVQQRDGVYHLCAGGTRLRACAELGISIPAHNASTDLPSEVGEFLENFARSDLEWYEEVSAVTKIHQRLIFNDPEWNQQKTAAYLGVESAHLSRLLRLDSEIKTDPDLLRQKSVRAAYNEVISRERVNLATAAHAIVCGAADIKCDTEFFDSLEASEEEISNTSPVVCEDFFVWHANYDGPRFNVIHCDFPYGRMEVVGAGPRWTKYTDTPDIYFKLLDTVLNSPHIENDAVILCWLDMKHFCATRAMAKHYGWEPTVYPFILYKTNRSGFMPGKYQGRRTYEVMHMFYRGEPIIGDKPDLIGMHAVDDNPLLGHAEKPIAFLQDKFRMFVGEHTRFLDPTCGSGTSLVAAADLGVTYIVGVESRLNIANYATARFLSR